MRKVLFPILIVISLSITTIIVIVLGRGYRFSLQKNLVVPTGLLVATSDPPGAEIFVDGKLKNATNTTLSLSPGWYQVKLVKEGFLSWEKKIRVQGEIVSETQAFLFPSTPSLTPLTTSGVVAPTLSPDGTKIAYAVSSPATKAGLWVLNFTSTPLGFSRDPLLITHSTASVDFTNATFTWSPDSKQILVSIGSNHFLLDADKENLPVLLAPQDLERLQNAWAQTLGDKEQERLATLPEDFSQVATQSGRILSFSPDETKILYQATSSAKLLPVLTSPPIATNSTPEVRELKPGKIYVYDLKEDKNYEILPAEAPPLAGTRADQSLSWFTTSRHLVMVESDKISILEYDGTNKTTLYNGPFEKFVATLPGGRKLLILTSYNRGVGAATGLSNLYSINLR